MSGENFFIEQQQAVQRMKQMSDRSKFKDTAKSDSQNFLKNIKSESDTSLILGLILLLYSEKGDRLLLLALLYILL